MMGNPSVADFPPHIQAQMRKQIEAQNEAQRIYHQAISEQPAPKRKSKFNNTRTPYKSVQGFTVMADSKLEAKFFARLDQEMVAGNVLWWIPHPRFPLPGGVVYEADALVVNSKYSDVGPYVMIFDAKGRDTQASINKRKQVKDLFGIDVELVRK